MLTQTVFPNVMSREMQKMEETKVIQKKVSALVAAMTVPEKFSLLHGYNDAGKGRIANAGYLPGVPRLGVPEIRMYDGPAGVTSTHETTGLPCPLLLSATWDDALAYQFGAVAGSENRAISGNMQLGSQLDTIRTPHYGRNKDMKSEDYVLSGRMGAAEVRGIQDQGVVAVLKHFAAANVQADGGSDVLCDEQTLHENYLRPFRWAITEENAGAVMAAGHKFNGHFCNDSAFLLKDVLRDMWGYQGFVMSDWGSNHTMSLDKGTDMEMPLPSFHDDYRILRAIAEGTVSWDDVDRAVSGILYAMGAVGLLSLVELDENGTPKEEWGRTAPIKMSWEYEKAEADGLLERNAAIAEQIALEGTVLLKNENAALPLTPDCYSNGNTTAIVGLGGVHAICGSGGERSFGRLDRMISPLDALKRLTGGDFTSAVGVDIVGEAIPGEYLYQDEAQTKHGAIRSYGISEEDVEKAARPFWTGGNGVEFHGYNGELDDHGDLVVNRILETWGNTGAQGAMGDHPVGEVFGIDETIDFTCGTLNYRNGEDGNAFSNGEKFTWHTFLTVPEDGEYILKLEAIGGQSAYKICVDGQWISVAESDLREGAHWPWDSIVPTPEGMTILSKRLELKCGVVYPVVVYGTHRDNNKDFQLRLAWITPEMLRRQRQNVVDVVKAADEVVLFLNDFEDASENMFELFGNREDLSLRPSQKNLFDLVQRHRAPETKLVTVLQSPAPNLIADVAEQSDAVMVTYLPGQECGMALAKLLTGRVSPSGKLPMTIPARNEDTPATDTEVHTATRLNGHPVNGRKRIEFSEGIFTGYRWYDKNDVTPLYPFGYGISYTTFRYSEASVRQTEDGYQVTVKITNIGNSPGSEVVQLYMLETDVPAHIQIAKKQLVAYGRTAVIQPGEGEIIKLTIPRELLAVWNPALEMEQSADGTFGKWQLLCGSREFAIAASSRDFRLTGKLNVQ